MSVNDKKTSLCVILPSHWSASFGGAEQQTQMLLEALVANGMYDVTYITKHVDSKFEPAGYRIKKIPGRTLSTKFGLIADMPALLSVLKSSRPDIIYQRTGCAYTGLIGFYTKHMKCRTVWHVSSDADVIPTEWGNRLGNKLIQYAEKKILEYGIRNVDKVLVQTQRQRELLNAHYGVRASTVVRNYQPIPTDRQKSRKPVTVVWISNIKPMKRPEIFIDLAADLHDVADARFLIIGRSGASRWHDKVQQAIQRTPNLNYLGEIPPEQVEEILAQSHLLINTSRYEGFPNTFIQAWMRKVPVVSIGVNPDRVLDEQGIGVCAGSYGELLKSTKRLISDSATRELMGERARRYAIKAHSMRNLNWILRELEEWPATGRPSARFT